MEPVEVMIEDLARQIAEVSVNLAHWRTRAMLAEQRLAEFIADEDEDDVEAP